MLYLGESPGMKGLNCIGVLSGVSWEDGGYH